MGFLQAMRDKCKILTAGSPALGEPTPSYSVGSEIRCRFSREKTGVDDGEAEGGAGIYKAFVRVPRGTAVTSLDRVRITQRGRTTGLALDYYIVGDPLEPQDGREEIILEVKRIHGV